MHTKLNKPLVIASDSASGISLLAELWEYRELLLQLAYRDLKARYAQTTIGLLWGVIQSLATLAILSFVFHKALKVQSGTWPYLVFALIGIGCWNYFSTILRDASGSFIHASEMIKKVYFPRLIVPLAKTVTALVEWGISLFFAACLMVYYQIVPGWQVLLLPFGILLTVIAGLGPALIVSALSIRFRDVQHTIPFLVQIGLYVSPVAYPVSLIPQHWHWLYFFNPIAGIIEGFRWMLLPEYQVSSWALVSLIMTIVLLLGGLVLFVKVERDMADWL
jgi:lipopolysaccharide transport system permease protein